MIDGYIIEYALQSKIQLDNNNRRRSPYMKIYKLNVL